MARHNYFTHTEQRQSLGGAKENNPTTCKQILACLYNVIRAGLKPTASSEMASDLEH